MSQKFCICVPTYNNAQTVATVAEQCLEATDFPVLVVDDGSTVPVRTLVPENPRVRVLRFGENRGKGIALRTAIDACLNDGFTHMIAIDADGQHLPKELPKLVERSVKNPEDLIIGARELSGVDVPEISKFGRKFSNFWVKVQTGAVVKDSQSGLRIYPLAAVEHLKFITGRFDFEIEVLVRLLWRGVNVADVAVEVYYPPAEQRVSHFDKRWDNVRISLLNTYLVVLAIVGLHPLRRLVFGKQRREARGATLSA
jgi:glycosyltransferase involved in cell wall biosynthesis